MNNPRRTTNILQADLVLEDLLNNADASSANRRDNPLAVHYLRLDECLSKARKEFTRRYNAAFVIDTPVTEYTFHETIGTGGFGNVVLAKRGAVNYAAKIMRKRHIVEANQLPHVHNEIRVLDAFDFKFLVHLEDFVRTNCYVIMVMPLVQGGELFEYMKHRGKCDETQAKFYASQVILAFEYIHEMGVIYRDLKPENVLLDDHGYIKLADFGFCKKVDNGRTWSLCGTPEYLAPEIIQNLGYSRSVDWWSFGVFLFEMTAGFPPFFDKDPLKLYEKIVTGFFAFPPIFSTNLQHLLSNILQVDRTKRFGLLKSGTRDIKGHPWFKGHDWDGIFDKTVYPPYKPKIKGDDDISNFKHKPFAGLRECRQAEYEEEFAVIATFKDPTKEPFKFAQNHGRSRE